MKKSLTTFRSPLAQQDMRDREARGTTHFLLWFRALFYMGIVGGGWLVLLPLLLVFLENRRFGITGRGFGWVSLGVMIFATGVALALVAGYYLIVSGRGTPFPLDPTQQLVTSGPYAYIRNPQSIAMVLMVIGEIGAIQSQLVWLLLPLTLVYLELLVGPWEDRQLLQQHGEQYVEYRRRVRKWLPLWRPYQAQGD